MNETVLQQVLEDLRHRSVATHCEGHQTKLIILMLRVNRIPVKLASEPDGGTSNARKVAGPIDTHRGGTFSHRKTLHIRFILIYSNQIPTNSVISCSELTLMQS